MASMSTCFTVKPKSHSIIISSKPSILLKPSQLYFLRSQTSLAFNNTSKFRYSRGFVPDAVWASIGVTTSTINPGGVVESDRLRTDVRRPAMDAIDACGGRVTIGDVASKVGLKVNEAQKALQALAADTNGFLEVSDEGDVLYVFPKDYRSKLTAKSFRMKIEPLVEKAKLAAVHLVRASFGTALIGSILLVCTAIIVLISSQSFKRQKYKVRCSNSYKAKPKSQGVEARKPIRADDEGMNFIESVFSFVFGDGDPNQGIEEERWKSIGRYIALNGGVVTTEELAPYLDLETTEETGDDSYILPVLLRFDGQPEVDEEGNILYRFPSLQRSASPQRSGKKEYVGRRWADWVGGVEKFFKEKKWQFSKTSTSERAMVIGLGGLNLFGVIILATMLKNIAVTPSGFVTFVSDIFPLFQIYAGSFFAIPLIRWILICKTNAEIEKRNRAREQCSLALELPDPSLRRKLLSAQDMAQRTFIGKDQIVYSTDRDLLKQDYEARDWDQRFREIKKTD